MPNSQAQDELLVVKIKLPIDTPGNHTQLRQP